MSKSSRILGIDPGTAITGFGVIEIIGNRHIVIEYGTIKPKPSLTLAQKYLHIYDEVSNVILRAMPNAVSIETQFVHKNVQTAIKLGMARGAVVIAAAKQNIEVFEYTPMQAKRAVTGNGSSSKLQVAHMVRALLAIAEPLACEDISDALSLALAHAHARPSLLCTSKNDENFL